MDETLLTRTAGMLASCPGVIAVVLGGSNSTRTADERSDIDLGLYYRPEQPLDRDSLREIVSAIDDHGRGEAVTAIGAWGPWVNGGAWIEVGGQKVDLIYRDLGRVRAAIEGCRSGRIESHFQVGHPAGYSTQIYAGEIHLCRALQDPHHRIAALKKLTWPYPAALRRALIHGLWEARFLIDAATRSALRGDVYAVAGSAFRSVACIVQALFGLNERYWINEKTAIALVDGMPKRPHDFASRVGMILGALGTESDALSYSVHALGELLDESVALCGGDASSPR